MDPVEVRRINLIPKFEDGYDVAMGITYDSGDYQAASWTWPWTTSDYQELRHEQAHARSTNHGAPAP